MKTWFLLLLTELVISASAAIEFIAPTAGAILKAGDPLYSEWRQVGNNSDISDGVLYDIYLCAGGNDEGSYDRLMPIAKDKFFSQGNSASALVAADIGGNEPNAYFLQMLLTHPSSPEPIHLIHSPRFTLTSMTGTFPPHLLSAITSLPNDNVNSPPIHNELLKRQADLPYEDQTGPTRYAPMPMQPPTKISLKTAPPLHPPSAFGIAQSFLPRPTIQTTISAKATFSVESIENTAAPAPTDDEVQRFLNRWKD
ncbi:hypothetical protein AJ79_02830 [Helicocarpus griseus UAMH5409]|uniref:Uncharacterized protein n=1 Tax=Helicocarpus griseus UAMH5409 TaxID=1447875 RepID=A0A2B7XSR1_9EURO|nr:hypothetical protein AJ79_02830 [Helicocarpus griseus UAMH5409]